MVTDNKNMQLQGLRGATTSEENTIEAIKSAVNELVFELVNRNNLPPKQIVSITFSVTADLNACFPAAVARQQPGWENVALIDCQQMAVEGDLDYCIRILAIAWLPFEQIPQHPYLGLAKKLRPDRA